MRRRCRRRQGPGAAEVQAEVADACGITGGWRRLAEAGGGAGGEWRRLAEAGRGRRRRWCSQTSRMQNGDEAQ